MRTMITVRSLSKRFVLHNQGGEVINVFQDLNLDVNRGQAVALHGPSGAGKSTLLRSLYANYKISSGSILVRHRDHMVDMAQADPRTVLDIRKHTLGYVSQFLRVIPRVPTLEIVARARWDVTGDKDEAYSRAMELLQRLHIPRRLWKLAPTTFSGGEQQRVNIARGLAVDHPVLLLDEPTASLDPENRQVVVDLMLEAKERGATLVGIFHDEAVRRAVVDRVFTLTPTEHEPSAGNEPWTIRSS